MANMLMLHWRSQRSMMSVVEYCISLREVDNVAGISLGDEYVFIRTALESNLYVFLLCAYVLKHRGGNGLDTYSFDAIFKDMLKS